MERTDPIYKAIQSVIAGCGFDESESSTERFAVLLRQALDKVDEQIEESNKDGLCYHASYALARELSDILETIEAD